MNPITPQTWLERFNFCGNPFSSLEAGSEDDAILNQYFVAPPYFDEILGNAKAPKTMLVFAPRGGGKTAQRMMVHYYCQHELTNETVLSVPYANFNAILERADVNRDIARINVNHHIEEIIPRIAQSLLTFFAQEPIRAKILAALSKDKKAYLGWLIWHYQKYLSVEQRGDLEHKILLKDNDIPQNIKLFLRSKAQAPPIEHLKDFSAMLKEHCGIDAIYLLVDGVDEFYETASDIHGAIALIEPLLADLTSMELPCVAFKFFLPLEMEPLLRTRPAVRFDRLAVRRIERWDDESLLEIIHKRLQAFSHSYESLDAVCVPELRGRLEHEMVSLADGTPRNLIRLGNYLLQENSKLLKPSPESEEAWFISAEAWENAQEKFAKEKLPIWSIEEALPHLPQNRAEENPKSFTQITTNFPAPIAVVCRDFLNETGHQRKLKRLIDLFEVTLVFTAFLLIGQWATRMGRGENKNVKDVTKTSLKLVSSGGAAKIIRKMSGALSGRGDKHYGRWLQRFFNHYEEKIDNLLSLRNRYAHGALKPEDDYADIVQEHTKMIKRILEGLNFLAEGQLVKVDMLKFNEEQYVHNVRVYQGDNPNNFKWQEISLPKPLESDKLWWMAKQTLPFYPLIIAQRCPECGSPELFLYNRLENRNAVYLSYNCGHELEIAEYINDLKALLGLELRDDA